MSTAQTPSERPPAGSEDPVASLFSADRTLPAPVVAPEVNESELTRWKSARDSLFGESVKDPAPSAKGAAAPPTRTGRTLGGDDDEPLTEGRRAPQADRPVAAAKPRQDERTSDSGTPLVRALSVSKIGQQHEAARTAPRVLEDASDLAPPTSLPKLETQNKKKTALHAGAPPPAAGRPEVPLAPPPAAAKRGVEPPAGKKARLEPAGATRTKKKTPPPRPASAEVVEASAGKKKFRRGPKPLLLAALGMLVLAAGGVSAVVLEIVPDPFADPAQEPAARGRAPARAAAPSKPVAAAAPAAPTPQPGAEQPKAQAATPQAPVAKAAKAQAPAAQAAAPKPATAAAPPATAVPALDEATANAGTDQLISLARKALNEENAPQAEALARRALARDGDDHHAMEVLARSLIDQDRGPEAVTFARRIVDKRKKRVPYRLLLGDALLMIGDATGARREWQAAAELEPNNREVKQRLQ